MSSQGTVEITCPACGKKHSVSIWKSINTTLNPEMKQAVRDQSAFLFSCPTCGYDSYLNYGFLYHQMEDRIMIYYVESDEDAEKICHMFTDKDAIDYFDFDEQDYLNRIVRNIDQLREKLFIFDAGLDDRIIEIIKAFIFKKFQRDSENEDISEKTELYFLSDKDGKNYIQIIIDDETKGMFEVTESLYGEVRGSYLPYLQNIRKDSPFIDRQWATEFLYPSDPDEESSSQNR